MRHGPGCNPCAPGKQIVTPTAGEVPVAAEALNAEINDMYPPAEVPDILKEVHEWTGFSDLSDRYGCLSILPISPTESETAHKLKHPAFGIYIWGSEQYRQEGIWLLRLLAGLPRAA